MLVLLRRTSFLDTFLVLYSSYCRNIEIYITKNVTLHLPIHWGKLDYRLYGQRDKNRLYILKRNLIHRLQLSNAEFTE